MTENEKIKKILSSYKQSNALLLVVGILLGSYTIMVPGLYATMAWIVSLMVVFFGAYRFYFFLNVFSLRKYFNEFKASYN